MNKKFRAWDLKEKKIHYFEGIFNQRPYTEKSTFPQYDSSPEYHELILEQFTGLTDKNGREIYEGDIIQMPHVKSEGYVIDENGMWKSEVVRQKDGRWTTRNGVGFQFAYGVEVIGNIHESEAPNDL